MYFATLFNELVSLDSSSIIVHCCSKQYAQCTHTRLLSLFPPTSNRPQRLFLYLHHCLLSGSKHTFENDAAYDDLGDAGSNEQPTHTMRKLHDVGKRPGDLDAACPSLRLIVFHRLQIDEQDSSI